MRTGICLSVAPADMDRLRGLVKDRNAPLMNEVKKLPSFGRRWRTHRREPQLFIVDALAAGVHAMIAGQLGGAN
jgi:hypothetical protein